MDNDVFNWIVVIELVVMIILLAVIAYGSRADTAAKTRAQSSRPGRP